MINVINNVYSSKKMLSPIKSNKLNANSTLFINKKPGNFYSVPSKTLYKENSLLNNIISFTGNIIEKTSKPVAAIIEKFNGKAVDIDGDSVPDISHGKLIETIAKATYPDSTIKRYELKDKTNDPYEFDIEKLTEQLNKVSEDIDKREKIKAVNLSLSKDINIEFLRNCSGILLQGENLDKKQNEIRNWLKNPELSLQAKALIDFSAGTGQSKRVEDEFRRINEVVEAIEKITRKNVPVYVGAGNKGPEFMNIFSLAKGSIPIGGQNTKGEILPFSANNNLVKRFEQGIYNVTPVKNGFDITGSGKEEISNDLVSDGESPVKYFAGKKYDEVIAHGDDYSALVDIANKAARIKRIKYGDYSDPNQADLAKKVQDVTNYDIGIFFDEDTMKRKSKRVLFPVKMISILYGLKPKEVNELKSKGDFVNASLTHVFKADKNGNIIYDPDGSGRPSVNEIWGTSTSAPKAMMKDLKKKYCTDNVNNTITPMFLTTKAKIRNH